MQDISTLLPDTIYLLQERPRRLTFDKIAADTSIPKEWLKALAQNRIREPSVVRIVTLREYFEKQYNTSH